MKKLFKHLSLILLCFFVLVGCQEKKKLPQDTYKGAWKMIEITTLGKKYTNDSTVYMLNINHTGSLSEFSSNCFPFKGKVKGTWSLLGDSLTFNYIAPNLAEGISSLNIISDSSANSKLELFQKGKLLGYVNENGVQFEETAHYAKVLAVDENHLSIQLEDVGTMLFEREAVKETGFSIISIIRGIFGLAFLLAVSWFFSSDRKSIDWQLVWKGVLLQLVIALLVLKAPFVEGAFTFVSQGFVTLINYTNEGVDFVFGQFGTGKVQPPLLTFAFKVLPTIIFFSALMSLLYYWGILQKVVFAFAWLMKKFMRLSGAESLAAAGNVFLGQTESPLLVKPFLLTMTKSEVMCLMTGGMATIAGGVLASYIGYLGGDDPEAQIYFAKHLLTASVISAPAAIVAAKMLVPETEKINENLEISKDKIGTNALEAISNGTTDGLKLAVNVGAMLIVFISLVALANGILGFVGGIGNLNGWIAANTAYEDLSFEFILGYACAPIVWILGVDAVDMVHVGELLGQKTILNEFYAYGTLGQKNTAGVLNDKSVIMATYMLCGFANIASIGIQIGGIGALVPSRKGLLSQLGIKALIGGTIACLLTAVVVGMTL